MDDFRIGFDKIYLEYFPRLYRFAKAYVISEDDAKNIVQDVFTLVWEKKAILKAENPSTYLFSLVKNRCIDLLRHSNTVKKNEKELAFNMMALEQTDVSDMEAKEKKLSDAIDSLPDKCREIFILSKIKGKKQREIADILGISLSTVESQMSIALKKIQESFFKKS